jgi:hypothetical protein
MSALVEFVHRLLTEGSVVLRQRPHLESAECEQAVAVLEKAYRDYRLDVAGPLLDFDRQTALAATAHLWFACWFLLVRDDPPEEVARCLHFPASPRTAAEHLSGDLVLRFLPQVYRRARGAAVDDVLTTTLAQTLRRWPLTGVLSEVAEAPLTAPELDGHSGLLLLYAERLAGNLKRAWVPAEGLGREQVERVFAERGLAVQS